MSEKNKYINFGLRICVATVSHPIDYAKVLIQLGYEPMAPVPSTTLLGKPVLKLPNIFQYIQYIKSVDGFTGCYTGLMPKLCGSAVGVLVSKRALQESGMNVEILNEFRENVPDEEVLRREYVKNIKKEVIGRFSAIIVSHPFHVISLRMMAQFIGREVKYSGMCTSMKEIYKQNGILGFFSGLIPRLFGEAICLLLANVMSYALSVYVINDKELRTYVAATMSFLASGLTYPFQVAANCMAVSGSGLAAGSPPHMPEFKSWIECWVYLSDRNQLKRGSSLILRYYDGPKLILSGRAVPLSHDKLMNSNYQK